MDADMNVETPLDPNVFKLRGPGHTLDAKGIIAQEQKAMGPYFSEYIRICVTLSLGGYSAKSIAEGKLDLAEVHASKPVMARIEYLTKKRVFRSVLKAIAPLTLTVAMRRKFNGKLSGSVFEFIGSEWAIRPEELAHYKAFMHVLVGKLKALEMGKTFEERVATTQGKLNAAGTHIDAIAKNRQKDEEVMALLNGVLDEWAQEEARLNGDLFDERGDIMKADYDKLLPILSKS